MLRASLRHLTEQPVRSVRSGFISSNPAGAALDGGLGELLLSLLMGAFCGLILGFIFSSIMRYIAFFLGRKVGGYGWTVVGALVGAAVFGWISLSDPD